jgi:dipeptidyl-peptidase-3
MRFIKIFYLLPALLLMLAGCQKAQSPESGTDAPTDDFQYLSEQFADLKLVRYQIPGFDELSLQQKKLCYYLYEAALAGRDIMWDQNYKHNLKIRKVLEAVVENYKGDRESEDFKNFMVYTKRVWFSNGIHHHYGSAKIMPEFSAEYFAELVKSVPESALPLTSEESVEGMLSLLQPVMFDPEVDAKKVNLDPEKDLVAASAVNFYEGVTQKEVEAFYAAKVIKSDTTPISYGLNSKLLKVDGKIVEKVWKVGGMYSPAIEKIVYWLEKASSVAENEGQKKTLDLLIEYYKTGDLRKFDEYNIAWVNDTESRVDVINGFIEVYNDPMGYRGSYESVVSIKDMEATKRMEAISNEAQWFEDNSPLKDEHKKKNVKGISAKVITVVMEAGDASPSTPIGINLPNANWIRKDHGSKSVNLGNIVYAYDASSKGSKFMDEFAWDEAEKERSKKYGSYGDILHTDLHEVLGHASGQINPGIGTPKETLKNYASTLEEGRADLFALYYITDKKLMDMGLVESEDLGKSAYDDYIRNGLMTQLKRIEPGENIEESHMRNRQMIAKWAYEKGKAGNVIEKKTRDGKTFFVINDYGKLRVLFGDLLREIQRIKSEGDYEAGKALVETYGVNVDPELHAEVLARFEKLNIAPYGGFINPKLVPVMDESGEITGVNVEYPTDFSDQMMFYGKNYSFLPVEN